MKSKHHVIQKEMFSKMSTKNAQTTTQLHSSHRLVNNAQNSTSQASTVREPWLPDVRADFRKAEEPEIKLPTSAGSLKK